MDRLDVTGSKSADAGRLFFLLDVGGVAPDPLVPDGAAGGRLPPACDEPGDGGPAVLPEVSGRGGSGTRDRNRDSTCERTDLDTLSISCRVAHEYRRWMASIVPPWLPGAGICVKRTEQNRGKVGGLLSARLRKVPDTDVISAMVRLRVCASAVDGRMAMVAVDRRRRLRQSQDHLTAAGLSAVLVMATLSSAG